MATLILSLLLIIFFIFFERNNLNSKKIALISALTALAALGRVGTAGIANIQPTTFLVIVSGYALGANAGFMIGAMSALVSNFILGQGPWTPWQMLAWGIAGTSAGLLKKLVYDISKIQLTVFCGIWGYLFGWVMNIWTWASYIYPHDLRAYLVLGIGSFWFDTFHALGNIILAWILGKEFIKIITRFGQKTTFNCLYE